MIPSSWDSQSIFNCCKQNSRIAAFPCSKWEDSLSWTDARKAALIAEPCDPRNRVWRNPGLSHGSTDDVTSFNNSTSMRRRNSACHPGRGGSLCRVQQLRTEVSSREAADILLPARSEPANESSGYDPYLTPPERRRSIIQMDSQPYPAFPGLSVTSTP